MCSPRATPSRLARARSSLARARPNLGHKWSDVDGLSERAGTGLLVDIIASLRSESLLDWTGGAISVRVGGSLLISPGGSARRLWRVRRSEILIAPIDGELEPPTVGRYPLGIRLHQLVYSRFDACRVILHTHAGFAYVASCLAAVLDDSPPTRSLGVVPCLAISADPSPQRTLRGWEDEVLFPDINSFATIRSSELVDHGLAFLEFQHGVYVLGTDWSGALIDLARVEVAARLWVAERSIGTASERHSGAPRPHPRR